MRDSFHEERCDDTRRTSRPAGGWGGSWEDSQDNFREKSSDISKDHSQDHSGDNSQEKSRDHSRENSQDSSREGTGLAGQGRREGGGAPTAMEDACPVLMGA